MFPSSDCKDSSSLSVITQPTSNSWKHEICRQRSLQSQNYGEKFRFGNGIWRISNSTISFSIFCLPDNSSTCLFCCCDCSIYFICSEGCWGWSWAQNTFSWYEETFVFSSDVRRVRLCVVSFWTTIDIIIFFHKLT